MRLSVAQEPLAVSWMQEGLLEVARMDRTRILSVLSRSFLIDPIQFDVFKLYSILFFFDDLHQVSILPELPSMMVVHQVGVFVGVWLLLLK